MRISDHPHSEPGPWFLGPYFILATFLLLTAIAYPLAKNLLGSNVLQIITTGLLAACLYAVINRRTLFRTLAFIIIPLMIANWLVDSDDSHVALNSFTTVATELFFIAVLVTIFIHIIRSKRVTADLIFGSIAIYLLFGVVMAFLYHFINDVAPGTVISAAGEATDLIERRDQFADFLYFSFITLTSVGYGDLAPLGPPARSLAMFEGIVGQLYVAILVARLVGIQVAQE